MSHTQPHIPVLSDQILALLNPQPGDIYLDGTAGYGGHAAHILDRIGLGGHAILVDRDRDAITALRARFGAQEHVTIMHRDYVSAAREFAEHGRLVDMVLLDLGVSSPQLDNADRGFSFNGDGPLDMRMDRTQSESAADVVNKLPQTALANVIYDYGEERYSRRIAKAIVDNRPIQTTQQLAKIIVELLGRRGEIHPATRTFQALRIYVNQELTLLKQALPLLVDILKPGGRIAVISFHSLEDRIVKEFFATESKDCICPPQQPICTCNHRASLARITKKAISGTEDAINPRARSAKLRAAVKIKTKKEHP